MSGEALTIDLGEGGSVSGLIVAPTHPRSMLVLAHGAGAGMRQAFLEAAAKGLCDRGIATLRYNFLYMEKGSKRPDSPAVAHAAVRAAFAVATARYPAVPVFAGGKSFGGRMTSQAEAADPLPGLSGLVFFGFPLHPPGKPSTDRADHLFNVRRPMLFLQGTRDEFADLTLLEPLMERLGENAQLELFAEADHSFHVLARSGKRDADVREELLDKTAAWMAAHA